MPALGMRIGVPVAAVALALASPAAGAWHGTPVVSGPVQSETAAQIMRRAAQPSPRPRALPARRRERPTGAASGGIASPPARFTGRATALRTSFAAAFDFPGPTLADAPGVFPPDTQGAVGPAQFLVTINGRFRSYGKASGLPDGALDVDPDVFFAGQLSPAPSGGVVFSSDPHVRYDRLSQRWFIVMIDAPLDNKGDASVPNRILLAHSDGPVLSPSTVWTKTFIQVSGAFADYPTLGVDANALYVGTNNFSTSNPFGFVSTSGYVIRKSAALGGGPVTATKFALASGSSTGVYTPQGADNPDPAAAQGYFVGVDNAGPSRLEVVRISSPGGTPTASGPLAVDVPVTRVPINVPNLGGSTRLDPLDDRLFAASIRDGMLWTAHNIAVDGTGVASGSADRDGSRWYELSLGTTPSLVQSGTVFDPSAINPLSYWIPTVAVSGQGHMAIGGSVAGAAHHADAWFSGRLATDALGALDAPTLYTASTAAYNPPFDTGNPRRWGDYSAVSLDPVDDMTLWTIQEYVSSTNTWGTRIARLRAPGPATPIAASRAAVGQAATTVTLTGSTAGGLGFYDPGPGFARPQVTAGCGIAVTSVTVDNPGQATLGLDTTGATGPSPCTVTFTNPDGQSASAAVLDLEHAPVAVGDTFTVRQGSALHGASLLANDSDPDGDPLTAAKAADPAHGTAAVNPDGTFTYVPAAGYSGADTFTYAAGDGTQQSTATASITVVRKLTIKLRRLKGKRLRVRISGAGPDGARVRVTLKRGSKRVATRSARVVKGRWSMTVRLKRHGRYRATATAAGQRATAKRRI